MAMNEAEVLKSRHYLKFVEQAHEQLVQVFVSKIKKEVEQSYVQIAINNHKRREETQRVAATHRRPGANAAKVGASVDEFEVEEGLQLISEIIDPQSYIYL